MDILLNNEIHREISLLDRYTVVNTNQNLNHQLIPINKNVVFFMYPKILLEQELVKLFVLQSISYHPN
jgi:hypothetical protein